MMNETDEATADPADAAESASDPAWVRVGEAVRSARLSQGWSNRAAFAKSAGVSTRVLSDLETAARSTVSDRILERVESALGWSPGSITDILTDPGAAVPQRRLSATMLFHPPKFDREPVDVPVGVVENAISILQSCLPAFTDPDVQLSEQALDIGRAATDVCWPYLVRLVEDNCLPGDDLHPMIRPAYEAFFELRAAFGVEEAAGLYVRWLAGDYRPPANTRRAYKMRYERNTEMRRSHSSGQAGDVSDGGGGEGTAGSSR